MNVLEINLDDLTRRYTGREGVVEVIDSLNASIDGGEIESLTRALSESHARILTGEEFRLRQAINGLLSFYGAIEIASLIRFVPDPLPAEFRETVLSHLRYPALMQYYEHHYRLLLPQRLRERLERKRSLPASDEPQPTNLFIQFLGLNGIIEGDKQVAAFESLMQRRSVEGHSLKDMMDALESPQSFITRIEHPPRLQDETDRALHGLFIYLTFCYEFDLLLQQSSEYPLLRSSMWSYHGHWFDVNKRRVADVITMAIKRLKRWPKYVQIETEQIDAKTALRESQESIDKTMTAMSRLVSGNYGAVRPAPIDKFDAAPRRIKAGRRDRVNRVSQGPIQATVILDSGCFFPMPENGISTEVGYFGSSRSVPDFRMLADGIEVKDSSLMNLGKKRFIEIRHVKANGIIREDGVQGAPGFHDLLLHMKDLYGHHMPIDPSKFDSVIHFDSGYFVGALVKPRYFEEYRRQPGGRFEVTKGSKRKLINKPIAHAIHVHFKLEKGESLELAWHKDVFWSSKDTGAKERLEVEIIADNSTVEKFYRLAFREKRDSYWLPNSGDPPPMCAEPPCNP